MKRKGTVFLLACLLPLVMLALVYQSYAFGALERDIADLQRQERSLIERNKRHLAAVGLLSSAGRIRTIATEELSLTSGYADGMTIVRVHRPPEAGE